MSQTDLLIIAGVVSGIVAYQMLAKPFVDQIL